MNKYWPLQKKKKIQIKISKDPIYLLTRVKLNVIVYDHQHPCPQNLRPPKTICAHRAPAKGALHCGWTPWIPGITQKISYAHEAAFLLWSVIFTIRIPNRHVCEKNLMENFLLLIFFLWGFSEQEQFGSGIFMFTATWHQGSFLCERASKG